MRQFILPLALGVVALTTLSACDKQDDDEVTVVEEAVIVPEQAPTDSAQDAVKPNEVDAVYKVELKSLNTDKIGTSVTGEGQLIIRGDELEINLNVLGSPKNMQHWQHIHGNPDGSPATCATPEQDVNHDGYVDLPETAAVSGTTMVPFNDNPAALDIPTNTYPQADEKGDYAYYKQVKLSDLDANFTEKYKGAALDLDKRVIYIHGVPDAMQLPDSVQGNVANYTPHTTLPIACGKIEKLAIQ